MTPGGSQVYIVAFATGVHILHNGRLLMVEFFHSMSAVLGQGFVMVRCWSTVCEHACARCFCHVSALAIATLASALRWS